MVSENKFNNIFAHVLAESNNTPLEMNARLEKVCDDLGIRYNVNQFHHYIDPFNLMAFCNLPRNNRDDMKKAIAKEFGFKEEVDERSAVPLSTEQLVAFVFNGIDDREKVVDKVWDCFRTFVKYADGNASESDFIEAFDYCSKVKGMVCNPHRKLTMCLYWIESELYVSFVSFNTVYLSEKGANISFKKVDGKKYLLIREQIKSFMNENGISSFDELSKISYEFTNWGYENYDSKLMGEQWVELLANRTIVSDDQYSRLKDYLDYPEGVTCKKIAKDHNLHPNDYKNLDKLAKKIQKETGCNYPNETNAKYWPIIFNGRSAGKGKKEGDYIWRLRDEVAEAIALNEETKVRDKVTKASKNIIFYGPPGTGKTYNTYSKAVEIIEGVAPSDFNGIKKKYGEYVSKGQIQFITFHQSYSYEEFIEGIRPHINWGEVEDVRYEGHDGIFKQFCRKIENSSVKSEYGISDNPVVWKVSLEQTGPNTTREECLKNNHIRIGWDEYGETITPDMNYYNGGKAVLNAFINEMEEGDIIFSCFSEWTIDAIGVVEGPYEWVDSYDKYKRVRKVKWIKEFKDNKCDISEVNDGVKMTLSTVYRLNRITKRDVMALMDEDVEVDEERRYVFIIDEINRGNISSIFGELITLIEETKRMGEKEELKVILPYSNEPFGIPSNLYIIGTMNTADRSLVSLDSALRRRFKFIEMMPDYKLCSSDCEGVDVQKLLRMINERITNNLDREHVIGHSYLMKDKVSTIEELADAFINRIVPLLQEYFYDDPNSLKAVLSKKDDPNNSPFVRKDGEIVPFSDPNNGDKNVWKSKESYMSLYESSKVVVENGDSE